MNRTNESKYIFHDLVAMVALRFHYLHFQTGKLGNFIPEQLLFHTTVELYDPQSHQLETVNLAGKPHSNNLQREPMIQLVTWI